MNYYNEFDQGCASWLRELIREGLIPEGEVDVRSIVDVSHTDLKGFNQCHFFAGIGGWSYALRLAGTPDDFPIWTGSCPCQPFSTAGKNRGKQDVRHLWPVFFELIRQCRPPVVLGEQVSSAIKHGWLDDLCDDLEREGYTTRAQVLPACSVGAPHKRDRLYWLANNTDSNGTESLRAVNGCESEKEIGYREEKPITRVPSRTSESVLRLGDTDSNRCQPGSATSTPSRHRNTINPTNWTNIKWVQCRDNKQRPIKPSIMPLVDGVSARVVQSRDTSVSPNATGEAGTMRIRGFGNAIVPQLAAAFIESNLEVSIV